jgi:hypothetical protein
MMNNERIKELEKQCYVFVEGDRVDSDTETFEDHVIFDKEKFAELIVKECAKRLMQDDFGSVKGVMSIAGARLKEHFGVE